MCVVSPRLAADAACRETPEEPAAPLRPDSAASDKRTEGAADLAARKQSTLRFGSVPYEPVVSPYRSAISWTISRCHRGIGRSASRRIDDEAAGDDGDPPRMNGDDTKLSRALSVVARRTPSQSKTV
jgi:hypothetical protein